jgi:hypothetical protein
VSTSDVEVVVKSENKKDRTFWLILKTGVEGKWYPQGRLTADDDSGLSSKFEVHLGSKGAFQMLVYATDATHGAQLSEYLSRPADEQTGLAALPEGSRLLTSVDFKNQ